MPRSWSPHTGYSLRHCPVLKEAKELSLVLGQFRKEPHLLSSQQHYTIILVFEGVARLPLRMKHPTLGKALNRLPGLDRG